MTKQDTKTISKFFLPYIGKLGPIMQANIEQGRFTWNEVMFMRFVFYCITSTAIEIEYEIEISWWFKNSKTGTYPPGAGGGGGWTEERDYFDSTFGKFYNYSEDRDFINTKELVLKCLLYFIKWYNKTLTKDVKKETENKVLEHKEFKSLLEQMSKNGWQMP